MSKKKEFIWGTIVNLGGGLRFDTPQKFYKSNYSHFWYMTNRNDSIKGEGLYKDPDYGFITFGSKDKHEVEIFIMGAKSLRDILLNNTLYKENK